MKILITAFIGSDNLGDKAIFRTILREVSKPNSRQVTALSINPERTKQYGIDARYAKSIIDIVRGIKETDVVLMGGGGIIQDQSSILNFLYYSFQMFLARIYNKPLILCFVGVGPLRFGFSRHILSKLISGIDFAIVRDEYSEKELLNAGMSAEHILQVHDPVLNFSENAIEDIGEGNDEVVTLSLRRWFFTNPFLPVFITRRLNKIKLFRRRYDEMIAKIATSLDEFLEDNKQITIQGLSLYDGEDDVVIRDVKELMSNSDRVFLQTGLNEDEYLEQVKASRFLVGMRLHSLILAATVSKPFVAIRYSAKVDEFTRQLNLEQYSVHVNSFMSEQLTLAIERMSADHTELNKSIESTVSGYKMKNNRAFEKLNNQLDKVAG